MTASKEHKLQQSRVIQNKSKNVIQKFAVISDRPLNGLRNLAANIRIGTNQRLCHRHIFFNNNMNLPTVGRCNNIGFRNNTLFNDIANIGNYYRHQLISTSFLEDLMLSNAIHANANPGNYNLLNNNCQVWVRNVVNSYNQLRQRRNLLQVNYLP